VRLTLQEVLFDGIRLSVGYTTESADELHSNIPRVLINGEPIHYRPVPHTSSPDNGKVEQILYIDPEKPLPDEFALELQFTEMLKYEGMIAGEPKWHVLKGDWHVSASVTKASETQVWEMSDSEAGSNGMKVRRIEATPIQTIVDIDWIQPTKDVTYNHFNELKRTLYRFAVYNDRGEALEEFDQTTNYISDKKKDESSLTTTQFRLFLEPMKDKSEYLTVVPLSYTYNPKGGEDEPYHRARWTNRQELPVTLSQGAVGTITVDRVEISEERTWVDVTTEGIYPYEQAWSLLLDDDSDMKLMPIRTETEYKGVENGKHKFTLAFPAVEASRALYLAAYEMNKYERMEGMKMKVSIK